MSTSTNDVAIAYVAQLYDAQVRLRSRGDRSLAYYALSFTSTLVLSSGLARSPSNLSLAGVEVEVPSWIFLMVLLILGFHHMLSSTSQLRQADRLQVAIREVFASCGYDHRSMNSDSTNPWGLQGILGSVGRHPESTTYPGVTAFQRIVVEALAGVALFIIPPTAALCAMYRVVIHDHKGAAIAAAFVAIALAVSFASVGAVGSRLLRRK